MTFIRTTILLLGLVIAFLQNANAGIVTYSAERHGAGISNPGSLVIQDQYWSTLLAGGWSSDFDNFRVKNLIKLHYTGQLHKHYDDDWTVTVTFTYDAWDETCTTQIATAVPCTLEVNYDHVTGTFKDVDLLEYTGAHKMSLSNISVTSVALSNVAPQDVYLEMEMEVERYFDFDFSAVPTINHETPYNASTAKTVTLYWPFMLGAEEYDLEWCVVSDFNIAGFAPEDYLKNLNYTRVTVSGNSYKLNLAYDNGALYYRVRGVGYQEDGVSSGYIFRKEGAWSDDDADTVHVKNLLRGTTDNVKGWTYQVAYAEEGKRKEVVSFFDASGRNRQTVTLNNTDDVALIAESFYDYEGRPVINTLPAPTLDRNNTLKFYEQYSLNGSGAATFRKSYYDVASTGDACDPEDIQMSTDDGASNYYSPDNFYNEDYFSNTTDRYLDGFNAFIPDAELYPFTRTIFDKKGRVSSQSGPGDEHAISSGHENKFFYTAPEQQRIDRLFGNHAGNASHYTMQAVKDANGQYSLTYKNLAGQVVATSLLGASPSPLIELESNNLGSEEPVTYSFNNSNLYSPHATSGNPSLPAYIVSKSFLVGAAGNYTFNYTLNPGEFDALCGDAGGNCTYDIIFTVRDLCQNSLIEEEATVDGNLEDPFLEEIFTYSVTLDANTNDIMEVEFIVAFPEAGTYSIEKKLTLNEAAMQTAIDDFTAFISDPENTENTCFDFPDLETIIDFTGCNDCEWYCGQTGVDCPDGYCESLSLIPDESATASCDLLLEQLEEDMSPAGQYFDDLPYGDNIVDNDWLNTYIFDESTEGASIEYTFGITGMNTWDEVRSGWLASFLTMLLKDNTNNPTYVSINGRNCYSLLEAHPEYCHYVKCSTLQASNEFTLDLLNVSTLADAQAAGWVPATPTCANFDLGSDAYLMQDDPFFTIYPNNGTMNSIMDGELTAVTDCLWEQAEDIVALSCSSSCDDEEWIQFRSLYLGLKQQLSDEFFEANNCSYLCDASFPPDMVADACSSAESEGFVIRYPGVNELVYNDDPDFDDDAEDNAEAWDMSCISSITIDLDAIDICSGFATCTTGVAYLYVNNGGFVSISDPIDIDAQLIPACSTNCSDRAQLIADAINSYSPTTVGEADFVASVNGCEVTISVPDGANVFNGDGLFLREEHFYCTSTNEQFGSFSRTCFDVQTSCACTDMQLNYDYFASQLDPTDPDYDTEAEFNLEVYTQMATAYGSTIFDYSEIEAILNDCDEFHWPCEDPNYDCLDTDYGAGAEDVITQNCTIEITPCDEDEESIGLAGFYETEIFESLIESYVNLFEYNYIQKCFQTVPDGGLLDEDFNVSFESNEYHFTLYYYDQVGNLTKTVPPAGVHPLSTAETEMVQEHRNYPNDFTKPFVHPSHNMFTTYEYNSFNQLVKQNTPDTESSISISNLNPTNNTDPLDAAGTLVGDAHMFDNQHGIAIGLNSSSLFTLFETVDGGASWDLAPNSPPALSTQINSIIFISDEEGYFVGHAGEIYRITGYVPETSATYTDLTTGTTENLFSITFIDQNNGYVVGNNGTLLHVSGAAVQSCSGALGISNNLIAIEKYGDNTTNGKLFIGGSSGYIARLSGLTSLPSSVTIEYDNTSLGSFMCRSIAVLDEGEKIIAGGIDGTTGEIHIGEFAYPVSPPYEINWNPAEYSGGSPFTVASKSINNLIVRESGDGYAVATSAAPTYATGQLFVTTDWGQTWDDQTQGTPAGLFYVNESPSGGIIITGNEYVMIGNVQTYSQRFWYDYLGRIKASQDARQAGYTDMGYSYTMYDPLGRPTEAGQTYADDDPTVSELNDDTNWPENFKISNAPFEELTQTLYDATLTGGAIDAYFPDGQENLRSRVSSVFFYDHMPYTRVDDYDNASHYSYDIHGNVKHLVQENKMGLLTLMDQGVKHLEYDYDLISGNVNEVVYQREAPDQWIHRYRYDADNRLVRAETSRDGNIWDRDAKYFYYLHGPMARTETGDKMVQGTDYAYTINGWLKSVNGNLLLNTTEMGKDGQDGTNAFYASTLNYPNANNSLVGSNIHRNAARDAFGFSLNYFPDDYSAAGITQLAYVDDFENDVSVLMSDIHANNHLYNGNISSMATALMDEDELEIDPIFNYYHYDQLQRLKDVTSYLTDLSSDPYGYTDASDNDHYKEFYSYDPNGNITALERHSETGASIDLLTYNYNDGRNQLNYLWDAIPTGNFSYDVDDQNMDNYQYDAMGNLIFDDQEEIDAIVWNVRGKVEKISRTTGSTKYELEYIYDASGKRICKIVKDRDGGVPCEQIDWIYTFYVYDAQGNVMATYDLTHGFPFGGEPEEYHRTYKLNDFHIYGASRLGVVDMDKNIYYATFFDENYELGTPHSFSTDELDIEITSNPTIDGEDLLQNERHIGKKKYELTNHLGNVLAVVTDFKRGVDEFSYETGTPSPSDYNYEKIPGSNEWGVVADISYGSTWREAGTDGIYDHYMPDVISYSDYYPFGMQMPDRKGSTEEYEYGFQGQLKDDELKGEGNSLNYEYRMHDPRIGRFFAVDPLAAKYAYNSPYAFSENVVINAVELEGLEKWVIIDNNMGGWQNEGRSYHSKGLISEDKVFGPIINSMTSQGLVNDDISIVHFKAKEMWSKSVNEGPWWWRSVTTYHYLKYEVSWNTYNYLGDEVTLNGEVDIPIGSTYHMGGNVFDYALALIGTGFWTKLLMPEVVVGKGMITGGSTLMSKARMAMAGDVSALIEIKVAKWLRNSGTNVEFLAGKNAADGAADLLLNGATKAEVKYVDLNKYTAKNLSKGAQQVGEGGTVYWVRPGNSNATLSEMDDFLKNFTPKDKSGNIIKNVTYKTVDAGTLPSAFGK